MAFGFRLSAFSKRFTSKSPKKIEQTAPLPHLAPFPYLFFNPSISARPPLSSGEPSKNPKSKLNEFCQSMKFSLPKYQISENSFVVTVSITIEGRDVCYSYTSEQAMSTNKYIKQCEENAAEIAFTALTELYGTCMPKTPPQRGQSYDQQSGNNINNCYLHV